MIARHTRLTILALSFAVVGCGSSAPKPTVAATTPATSAAPATPATPASTAAPATTSPATTVALADTSVPATAAQTSTVASSAAASESDITTADRALMEKSLAKSKITETGKKCILDALPGKVTRDEYLLLTKDDNDIPDDLKSRAGDIAIACATADTSTGASSGSADTTLAPTTVAAQAFGTKGSPVALGKKVSLPNGYDVVINSFDPKGFDAMKKLDPSVEAAAAGKQFVLFNWTITNVGGDKDKRKPAYDLTAKAVGGSGTAFENTCSRVWPDQINDYVDLFKGKSVTGNSCLEVDASDAKSLTIYFDVLNKDFDSLTYYFGTK
jgi:hypothetical protein